METSSVSFLHCLELPATLDATPAVLVMALMALFSAVASYIVGHHVVDSVDTTAVFIIGSYLIFSSYFVIHYFLDTYSSSYGKIDKGKQFYTLSNLIKSGVLASITPFACWLLVETLVYDNWHTARIRNLGVLYAIPDFVSMILVRRMSWATIVHHSCVFVFNLVSMRNDYGEENICRLIMVYAIFSTFAYLVNLLLASRFLGVSEGTRWWLSLGALVIYSTCCLVNWVWQSYYIKRLITLNNHWSIYVYCVLIAAVVYDDMVLTRWLVANIRGKEKAP